VTNALSAALPLTIAAINNWTGTATLACSTGLPLGYTCAFSPASVSGSGTTVLTIRRTSALSTAFFLVPFTWLAFRKRRRTLACVFLLSAALLSFSACGTSAAATQSTVTLQATSGNVVHSAQVILEIK